MNLGRSSPSIHWGDCFGWAYKRRGLYPGGGGGLISGIKKRFEMSHTSVDGNTFFLIYKFLIKLSNLIINRMHFNFTNKIKA